MNKFSDGEKKRDVTKKILEDEIEKLKKGYNPFWKKIESNPNYTPAIGPNTPFINALWKVYEKLEKAPSTKSDISSVIRGVSMASANLGLDFIPISKVTRKHFKQILIECKNVVTGWSPNRFNKYRAYLKILFGELIEYEATEIDPFVKIKRQKTIKRLRSILTQEERSLINKYLMEKHFYFWRFVQIFFHSGARESEMMLIRMSDVDLTNQRFKVTIKKGQDYIETWKTIKDIAMPLWVEVIKEAASDDYLFSKGLKPGKAPINPAQITRRWRTHIKAPAEKGGLGISADFYSLKHLHTTEVSEMLSVEEAAKHNSHSSIKMVTQIYDVRNAERRESSLKTLSNSFS